jgi:hypothetical protein
MSESRFRISLRSMLIVLAFVCVAFGALARPNVLVAIAAFNVTLIAIGAALIATILSRGDQQGCWFAFSVFAGGHLMLALGPGFDASTSHALLSSSLLRAMNPEVYPVMRGINWYVLVESVPMRGPPQASPLATSYVLTGHCLLSLLAGLLAAGVAWVAMPQMRRRAVHEEGTSETSGANR